MGTGNWFRISVSAPGMYRIDCPLLRSLGINTQGLASASLRLYGNGGQMLPEHPGLPVIDDLAENAIQITPLTSTITIDIEYAKTSANSSEVTIECKVVNGDELALNHVLNYPNPFTTHTRFWFEHNHPGEELQVSIQIYTVSGKLVKTIRRTIYSPENRSCEVEWDGHDKFGSPIGRGVYIYRLRVQTLDGKAAFKLEKLFIL